MCHWLAYSGGAVPIEEPVFKPERLAEQNAVENPVQMTPGEPFAFPDDVRVIVSEILDSFAGIWKPIDESTVIIVESGSVSYHPFTPRAA